MVLLQERVAAVLLQRLHGCPVHSFNVPQLALAAAHPDLGQGAMRTAAALRLRGPARADGGGAPVRHRSI